MGLFAYPELNLMAILGVAILLYYVKKNLDE
jgi:hypothetical protein